MQDYYPLRTRHQPRTGNTLKQQMLPTEVWPISQKAHPRADSWQAGGKATSCYLINALASRSALIDQNASSLPGLSLLVSHPLITYGDL